MQIKTINNTSDIEIGAAELFAIEPRFREVGLACGLPKFRTSDAGFSALFKIIVGQQLSTASAESIWKKLKDHNLIETECVLSSDDKILRSLGLSKTKVSYVKGLASAAINFDGLADRSDNDVIDELIAVRGIGMWTAQVYLMFCLRRQDVFAPGDLALREGARILFNMHERPSSEELAKLSQNWMPFRTIAAMMLWNYYGYMKSWKEKK